MSKTMMSLFLLLILIMMGAIGFLGFEVSRVKDLYYASRNVQQKEALDAAQVQEAIARFEEALKKHQDMLKEFSAELTKVSKDVRDLASREYMPAPEYSVDDTLFRIEKIEGGRIEAVGDRQALQKWMERNALFLEKMLLKSLPLDYDRGRRQVVVQDVIPRSLFAQMGLEKGDGIVSINGSVINQGPRIRELLVAPVAKQVVISRGGKRYTLDVSYKDSLTPKSQVSLNITKKQFDEALPGLLDSLKVEPARNNGDIVGVTLVELEPSNVFALMKFQPDDVITGVNGRPITDEKLVAAFQSAQTPLEIDFIRNEVPGKVLVKFSE